MSFSGCNLNEILQYTSQIVSQNCLCMKSKNQLHKLKGRILRKTKPSLVHLNVVGYKPPCSADTYQAVEPAGGEEQTTSETILTTLF